MHDEDDEKLLGEVVGHARAERTHAQHEQLEARLMALTEGTLSEPDEVALAAELARHPELEGVLPAFKPLGDAAKDRTAARILRDFAGAQAAAEPAKKVARRRIGPGATIVGALAVAAAMVLGVGALRSSRSLPSYELAVAGEQPLRGVTPPSASSAPGATDAFRFSRHERFRVLLRPARAFDGRVGARVFLVRGDDVRHWATPVDVSSEGAIRIVAPLDTLPPGSHGDWEMVVVVGRPEALPATLPPGAPSQLESRELHVLRARVTFDLE